MKIWEEIPKAWKAALSDFLTEEDHQKLIELGNFLEIEDREKVIYPPKKLRFKALEACSPSKTKVLILGQDPYHGAGQAMGLSFSVPEGIRIPPSLKNIYEELIDDVGVTEPKNGDLSSWANQGVLLLNAVLTVEEAKAGSHQKKGWEVLTKAIIKVLEAKKESMVFILWGSPAQKTAKFLDSNRHRIIKSVHPSPLSSYRGFFGSKPFSKANKYLKSKGTTPINWSLPS